MRNQVKTDTLYEKRKKKNKNKNKWQSRKFLTNAIRKKGAGFIVCANSHGVSM